MGKKTPMGQAASMCRFRGCRYKKSKTGIQHFFNLFNISLLNIAFITNKHQVLKLVFMSIFDDQVELTCLELKVLSLKCVDKILYSFSHLSSIRYKLSKFHVFLDNTFLEN